MVSGAGEVTLTTRGGGPKVYWTDPDWISYRDCAYWTTHGLAPNHALAESQSAAKTLEIKSFRFRQPSFAVLKIGEEQLELRTCLS